MPAPNGTSPVLELTNQVTELKKALEQAISQKASIETITQMQQQLDALDLKLANPLRGGSFEKSFGESLKENADVARLVRDGRGRAVINLDGKQSQAIFGRKSIITGLASGSVNGDPLAPVGVATSGVLGIERIPGITAEARQVLKIRDVLSARPTTFDTVDYVKVSSPLSIASPVVEAALKPENSLTFAARSERTKVLATFILASRQVISDFSELQGFLESSLSYYVDLAEESQLLSGDGTGENLNGLLHQATDFNTGLLPSSYNRIDVVGTAIEQIQIAREIDPSFIVLNPSDWWRIRLTKDSMGRYILGDPQSIVRPSIFGLDAVVTTSIESGTFLVGSGNAAAAQIRDRWETSVEISTEDSDNFRRNLVTIRAEKRLALVVMRPASFITGSFETSPES
jgi:HK97 family phage major capsid protein